MSIFIGARGGAGKASTEPDACRTGGTYYLYIYIYIHIIYYVYTLNSIMVTCVFSLFPFLLSPVYHTNPLLVVCVDWAGSDPECRRVSPAYATYRRGVPS